MKKIILTLVMITLTGCAGLNLEAPERWTSNNVFYSTKLPSIALTIQDPDMDFAGSYDDNKVVESMRGGSHTGKTTTNYNFTGQQRQQLRIVIGEIHGQNWSASKPDYNHRSWGLNFFNSSTEFVGKKFQTAILAKGQFLKKAYAAVYGDTVRLQIFYMEPVYGKWGNKNPDFLS